MGICCRWSCTSLWLGLAAALTSCAVHDTDVPQLSRSMAHRPAHALVGEPDFNWHLSGDRRVAPRQVFSDQGRIWLQWHPHQAVPTVFVDQFGSWQVVDQQPYGQYTVVDGHWQRLMFQGGQLQAMAVYRQAAAPEPVVPCVNLCPSTPGFDVRLSDVSIRQALRRWSEQANWFFDDAHWSLPVDFPVTAPATFSADFELAVRGLLESTRVSGQAVKPCFYANHVLRVIPAAQSCDPMADQGDRP
ncbi:TcpQ domain-containing protein [Orrella daihaiensis]|uniref:TcpQ domain-containing protein n=1 Tax=Orrella daihaiensis TaxID=2782176 RepID=A0ABY4AQA1_9BURK|nr:TcpQ domain-containing protein [Orrella daihaiensis]UOD51235.1 TcpQ domain-containing protein [Orrella daihaiensis]